MLQTNKSLETEREFAKKLGQQAAATKSELQARGAGRHCQRRRLLDSWAWGRRAGRLASLVSLFCQHSFCQSALRSEWYCVR